MKRSRVSVILLLAGLVFVAGALLWANHNAALTRRAGEATQQIVTELYKQIPRSEVSQADTLQTAALAEVPEYVQFPSMPMPVCEINGVYYIGCLSIPSLSLELSVASKCEYSTLDFSPCRYYGSAYQDNLVISAHNYGTHFGNIGTLQPGNAVYLTDMDGNVFSYRVSKVEVLMPNDTEEMLNAEYPLTLFTCTVGGKYRVTVRCDYQTAAEAF